jgi:hypothetical protein
MQCVLLDILVFSSISKLKWLNLNDVNLKILHCVLLPKVTFAYCVVIIIIIIIIIKVKVKFTPEQATKAQRGSRRIALLFL